MKPSKIETYMMMAEAASQRSHDSETKVGSVLIKESTGAILATGCNGFVRGADDDSLPSTRPDKYDYIVHSEMNLIANCARHGISMENCFVVCTMTPCKVCMRLLWQSGVTRVVAKTRYRDFDDILAMRDLKIDIRNEDQYIDLIYKVKHD
jgi:dCMP deaminase